MKNANIGRKLLITGKGVAILPMIVLRELIKQLPGNRLFVWSAFSQFFNIDMVELLSPTDLKQK